MGARLLMALLLRALLDPLLASYIGACMAGSCGLGADLARIARRESNLSLIGVHTIDARWSDVAWRNAVRVGWVDPQCQPRAQGWATRGSHGLFAAYSARFLWRCANPTWLDVPLISAFAAARRIRSKACGAHRRCRSWRGGAA